jgi:Ran GTPase-activating protein (RanGAP) involved in mRNA processing and transport
MFRRTSKRVKEQVDKMRLTVLVRLCQLWRDCITTRFGDHNGGRYNRVMENIKIVMNQLPVMTALFRITTLELHGVVAHHDKAAATIIVPDRAPESLTGMLQGVIGQSAGWLTHLDLNGNSLGSEGVSHLAGVLAQCTSLRYLGLGANSVQDDGAENVARLLPQCPALRTLDLHLNRIGCHGSGSLARVLVVCTALNKLDLAFNCIADCGTESIAAVLGECPPLGYLSLDLQENEIGTEHCRRLSVVCTGTLDIILDDSTSEEDEEEVEDLSD